MTYASASGRGAAAGRGELPAAEVSARSAGNPATVDRSWSVRTSTARLRVRRERVRSSGLSGCSGTYTDPAFSTASMATTTSAERAISSPTRDSAPTPRPASARARQSARRSSSR